MTTLSHARASALIIAMLTLPACGLPAEDLIARALVPDASVTVVITPSADAGTNDAGISDTDTDTETEARPDLADEAALVVTEGSPARSYLVLPYEVDDAPLLDAEFISITAVRSPVAAPTDQILHWQDREMMVFDAFGDSCTATTGAAFAVALVAPGFEVVDPWYDAIDGLEGPALDEARAAFAAELRDMGSPFLGLELDFLDDCASGPVWARPTTGTAAPLSKVELLLADEASLLAAFQDLPAFTEAQIAFASTTAGQNGDLWHTRENNFSTRHRAFTYNDSTIAFVTARAGQDCSEFYVYLTAVFVLDDGQWAPLTTDRVPAIPEILINSGDTLPTIVGIAPYDGWPRVLTEESQRSYQVASEVRSVEQGCRC